ncbi:PREDICTED: uncharacterized protein LOC105562204, partial [Vollenhovia emeryi]|uniref:uncharacterized protein LOC105562204 n=1 Tax=Vollenhovia emeryi TaxID=411798 RepID=UPI0005F54C59
MYRQVLLHEDDRRYQQILWRKDDKIVTFQLNTLTFGVASSPFLAIHTLNQLADDERQEFPRAAEILKNHVYVDDLLTGAETIKDARMIRDEITALLARSGFTIRQWASNDTRVIEDLADNALHANLTFNSDCSLQALGVSWDTRNDSLCIAVHSIDDSEPLTKRSILSSIAKIFDPLGLLGPVVLHAKRLIQDVWKCGTHWDESVPQSIHTEWSEFTRQLGSLHRVSFDRKLLVENRKNIEIHGFCDASDFGYGACLYIRSTGRGSGIISKLLCAKSRVAPVKPVTIPHLELCGALLLARLHREVSHALNFVPDRTIFWCDSTIVIHWLKTSPHRLKTYVANRVVEVQELTKSIEWRHIRSEDNPADAISRGQLPHAFLQNKIWHTGPSWLIRNENEWPGTDTQMIDIPELKGNTCLMTAFKDLDILKKYSSYSKLCRIVAYCFRWRPANKYAGSLCAREIDEAEGRVLKVIQTSEFADEIKLLQAKHSMSK